MGVAALLHDFDYERWPNTEHAADQGIKRRAKILRELGYPEEIVTRFFRTQTTNVPRKTQLEHTSSHARGSWIFDGFAPTCDLPKAFSIWKWIC